MGSVTRFISGLVSEEIRRLVAEAAKSGHMLSAADMAAAILKTYPKCGYDEAEIANEVMLKAAQAGVGVQIGRPRGALEEFHPPSKVGVNSNRFETL